MKEPVVKTIPPSSSTKRKLDGTKKESAPLEVKVDGIRFTTTPIFDMFWRYTADRHAAEERRRAGKPPPWSSDPALQTHKFCSIFRVADRGSQFLITEVIEKGSQLPVDILFRVLLYCSFVKIETYKLLEEHLGPLTWSSYKQKEYAAVLEDAMDSGMTLYTGAFQKFPPRLGDNVSYINHLNLLEIMMGNGLLERLMECKFMADAFDVLYVYPSMGNFMTFQLLINLSYTSLLNFNENDFVIAGVGAMEGLKKCFKPASLMKGSEEELIRWMTETQNEHFARLGLEFSGLGKRGRAMTLVDVEHTLCEVHKYSRLISERSSAHGKRFTPVTENLPRYPALPKAWNHPARKVVRRRPGKYEHPQKQFVVSKILEKAIDEDGDEIYFVDWQGYGSSDRTWEPADILLKDAPLAVEDFERAHSADGHGARRKRRRRS